MPLPTCLVVKNGSKIVSSRSGAIPGPMSVTVIATKSPLGGMRPEGRDTVHLAHADGQPAFAFHGVAAVDGDQRGLELGDVGNRKAIAVRYLDVDPDAAADDNYQLR